MRRATGKTLRSVLAGFGAACLTGALSLVLSVEQALSEVADAGQTQAAAIYWNRLCAEMDCGSLPQGFTTYDISNVRHYFPLAKTVGAPQLAGFNMDAGFVSIGYAGEFSDAKVLQRSFGKTVGIQFRRGFGPLLEWFDTSVEAEPIEIPSSVWAMAYPATLERYEEFEKFLSAPARSDLPKEPSLLISEAQKSNAGFCRVEGPFPDRAYRLISSRSLNSGAHVVGLCTYGNCDFTEWPSQSQRQSEELVIQLFGFPIYELENLQICGDDSPHFQGDDAHDTTTMHDVQVIIERLHAVLSAAKSHPKLILEKL